MRKHTEIGKPVQFGRLSTVTVKLVLYGTRAWLKPVFSGNPLQSKGHEVPRFKLQVPV